MLTLNIKVNQNMLDFMTKMIKKVSVFILMCLRQVVGGGAVS